MLELLAQLVSIRSLSREEDVCAGFVEAWLAKSGLPVRRIGNNIISEIGEGGPRLMLNSHIDTVPQCQGWEADPWKPRIHDGRLVGLGANDAKGCVAAMMYATRELQEEGWQVPGSLTLVISAEEEIGGGNGICSVLPELPPMDATINGEPTGLRPCNAQRGMLLLKCSSHGSSGHAAHAHSLGLANAIHSAAIDIARLAAMEFEEFGDGHIARPQVTTVQGGLNHNQVPDRCDFQVDLRTTPNLDHDEVLARIRSELDCEVSCRSARYLPVSTPREHPLVRAAARVTGTEPYFSNTCSDWNLYGGIPTVKIGPGESARSHRPEEFLLEQELADGVAVYKALVKAYFEEQSSE